MDGLGGGGVKDTGTTGTVPLIFMCVVANWESDRGCTFGRGEGTEVSNRTGGVAVQPRLCDAP